MCPFTSNTSNAKVADGRLVLSLPDAETPVVWILDLHEARTTVLRLETDRQGFFILKKLGGKGAGETVAVYRDRKPAARALTRASRALEKARDGKSSSLAGRIFRGFLYVCFGFYVLRLVVNLVFGGLMGTGLPQQASADKQAPSVSKAAGVPVSADEFLKEVQQPQ